LLTNHFLNAIPMRFGVCPRRLHEVRGCVLLTQACIASEITVSTHTVHTVKVRALVRVSKYLKN